MTKQCLGRLSLHDPLHSYLRQDILPQVGVKVHQADFRVFRLQGGNAYLYEEKHSHARVVGKFFGPKGGRYGTKAAWRMGQEFDNLTNLRDFGFDGYPHHVVRPLGANAAINSVLIEEYCGGESLSEVIQGALSEDKGRRLFDKLTALAYFLATLHNRSANGLGVDFGEECAYMDHLVLSLQKKHIIGDRVCKDLSLLRDGWREQWRMWEDQQVLVHGDATPSNFLFGEGLNVTAIDLERMRRADRVFDVGRIAGELQHFFLRARGNRYAAEPFIGHFLWEYACHFPDRDEAFRSITGRVPFQMGLTLLRIARNAWVTDDYRRCLIEEAKIILRSF